MLSSSLLGILADKIMPINVLCPSIGCKYFRHTFPIVCKPRNNVTLHIEKKIDNKVLTSFTISSFKPYFFQVSTTEARTIFY